MGHSTPRLHLIVALGAALLAAAPLGATKISHIGVSKSGTGQLIKVDTAGLTAPTLQKADKKLIIVVPGGERDLKPIKLGGGLIEQIRFGQDGKALRIVLDLKDAAKGEISGVDATGFKVRVLPVAAGSAEAKAEAAPAAAGAPAPAPAADSVAGNGVDTLNPSATGYTYRVVDLSLAGDEKYSELVISADGPASYKSSMRDNGRQLNLVFRNSSLAWSGDSAKLKDDAISGVAIRQETAGGESQVKIEIRLSDKLGYAFKRDQNQLVVRLDRPAKTEAAATTGDMDTPVSLDVQGADLVGILKTLCEQAGFDYQFTKDLLAKAPPDSLVTIKVDNRPFHEVLDVLLQPVGAKSLRQGNTIYMGAIGDINGRRASLPVVTRNYRPRYITFKQLNAYMAIEKTFDDTQKDRISKGISKDPRDPSQIMLVGSEDEVAAWIDIIKKYDVPERGEEGAGGDDDTGGSTPRTQVFHLQYLDISNQSLISGAINQLYPEGEQTPTILLDSATRTLVVTTPVKYLRKIEKLLTRIDVRPLQVNIEGKIVEVDQGLSQQLGINWNANTNVSQISSQATGLPVQTAIGSFDTGLQGNFTSQLQTATLVNGVSILATIQAMVDASKADIVSAPNVTTADNQQATISTNDVQVYTNTTTSISNGVVTTAQAYTTSNIPLILLVTPKISREDHRILMNINFQLTTTNGSALATGAPLPTSQQTASTIVSVNSGDTAVIGGLVRQNNTEETRKVPVLGDIPLLGLLFKYNTVSKTKKEVIIFITPTIVED